MVQKLRGIIIQKFLATFIANIIAHIYIYTYIYIYIINICTYVLYMRKHLSKFI